MVEMDRKAVVPECLGSSVAISIFVVETKE
jgi:hypothetical protein